VSLSLARGLAARAQGGHGCALRERVGKGEYDALT
jgi:hypothetical protein